jgi:hypothetical protein
MSCIFGEVDDVEQKRRRVKGWLEEDPWWPATNSGGDGTADLEDAEDSLLK